MKIYRLTLRTHSNQQITVYDSSEARIMRDYEHAERSRWTAFAEVAVMNEPGFIKRNRVLDALNGRTSDWPFKPVIGFEREEQRRAA